MGKRRVVSAQPIRIRSFHLTPDGIDIVGTAPTFPEYLALGDYLAAFAGRLPLWLAAWHEYGKSRKDWKARRYYGAPPMGMTARELGQFKRRAKRAKSA